MPVAAAVALGGWWVWFRPDSTNESAAATQSEQRVTATRGSMAQTISAEGTITPAQTDDLNFTSAGTVTAVNVTAGQTVKAGDVLATIDSAELQAAVAEAESSVADANAKLSDDEASGASAAQLTADKSSLASAQVRLDAARKALAGAQLVATFDGTVAAVNISVGEQLTSDGTGGTSQTGSQSGSGGSSSNLGNGNSSNAGQSDSDSSSDSSTPHIEVVSTARYTIELGIGDSDIAKVAVGQPATIALSTSQQNVNGPGSRFFGGGFGPDGFGNEQPADGEKPSQSDGSGSQSEADTPPPLAGTAAATGQVTKVGAVASASSGVATYPVTVAFTDTSGDYHAGATATVEITYAQKNDVVQVPVFAVTTTNGTSTVTVSKDGKTETRTVTTGLTSGGMVEITSGLAAGEQVVINRPNGNGAGQFLSGTGK
jgi:multidrug efflux pump subunit AcrA (membrane-fusion protein)